MPDGPVAPPPPLLPRDLTPQEKAAQREEFLTRMEQSGVNVEDYLDEYDAEAAIKEGADPVAARSPKYRGALHSQRYVQDADGRLRDTRTGEEVMAGVGGAEALMERQRLYGEARRAIKELPDSARVPELARARMKALREETLHETDKDPKKWSATDESSIREISKRIPKAAEAGKQYRALPEELMAPEVANVTRNYLAHMEDLGEDRPHTKYGLTPQRFVRMVESEYERAGKSLSTRVKMQLSKWAEDYKRWEGGTDESPRYAKRSKEAEDAQALMEQIESGDLTPVQKAEALQQMEQLSKSDFARRNWGTYNWAEKMGTQTVAGLDSVLKGYLPFLDEAVTWGATNLIDKDYEKNLRSMRGGEMHPEDVTSTAEGLGMSLGMMRSPIGRLFGGGKTAASGGRIFNMLRSSGAAARSGALSFGAISAANTAADEFIGKFNSTTGDWDTYTEQIAKEASKEAAYFKGIGGNDEEMKRRYDAAFAKRATPFLQRLAVDAANSAAQGALQGSMEPIGNILKASLSRFTSGLSPYAADVIGETVKNGMINMTAGMAPQVHDVGGGNVGWTFIPTDLADPAKAEGAIQGLIFNALISVAGGVMSGTRAKNQPVSDLAVRRAVEGAKFTPEQIENIRTKMMGTPAGQEMLQSLHTISQQTVAALKAKGTLTQGSMMEALQAAYVDAFQAKMKEVEAVAQGLKDRVKAGPDQAAVDEVASAGAGVPGVAEPVAPEGDTVSVPSASGTTTVKGNRGVLEMVRDYVRRKTSEAPPGAAAVDEGAVPPGPPGAPAPAADAAAEGTQPGTAPEKATSLDKDAPTPLPESLEQPELDAPPPPKSTAEQLREEWAKKDERNKAIQREKYPDFGRSAEVDVNGKVGTVREFSTSGDGSDPSTHVFQVLIDGKTKWVKASELKKPTVTPDDVVGTTPDGKEISGKAVSKIERSDGSEAVVIEKDGKEITVPAETVRRKGTGRKSRKQKAEDAAEKARLGLVPPEAAKAAAEDAEIMEPTPAPEAVPAAPVTEAPAPVTEAPAAVTEAPAPVTEAPAAGEAGAEPPAPAATGKVDIDSAVFAGVRGEKKGASVHGVTGEAPTGGFMVSLPGTEQRIAEGDFTPADVAAFREKNAEALSKPGRYVGAWVNDGDVVLDVSTRLNDRGAAEEMALKGGQHSIFNVERQDPERVVYTSFGGRKVGWNQNRVEQELAETMSKVDDSPLPNDPISQALAVLLVESKMKAVAGHRGEHLDDEYQRVRVEYMSAKDFQNWARSKRSAEDMKNFLADWTGPLLDKWRPNAPEGAKKIGGVYAPVKHPITQKVYTQDQFERGEVKVTLKDIMRATMAGSRNRFWYTDAHTGLKRNVPAEDHEIFTAFSAASSNGNTPNAEIANAGRIYEWYRAQKANGLTHEQMSEKWKKDSQDIHITGNRASTIRTSIEKYLRDGKFDLTDSPKIGRYFLNRLGNSDVITRDRWDLRFLGIDPLGGNLTVGERKKADKMYADIAEQLGGSWTGSEVQSSIWLTMQWRAFQNKKIVKSAKYLHERGIKWGVVEKLVKDGAGSPELADYVAKKTAGKPKEVVDSVYQNLAALVEATSSKAADVPPDWLPKGSKDYLASDAMDEHLGGKFMDKGAKDKAPRGMVSFAKDGTKALVSLLDGATASTVSHEFGHLVTKFMPRHIRAEIFKFFGRDPDDAEEALSRNEEEILARMHENYDVNGHAPSKGLEGVFARANEWIASVLARVTPDLKQRLDAQRADRPISGAKGSELMRLLHSKAEGAEVVKGAEKNVANPEVTAADIQKGQGLTDDEVISSADPEAVALRKSQEAGLEAEAAEPARPGAPTNEAELEAAKAVIRGEREAARLAGAEKSETPADVAEIERESLPDGEEMDPEVKALEKALNLKDDVDAERVDVEEQFDTIKARLDKEKEATFGLPQKPSVGVAAEPLDFGATTAALGRAVGSDAADTAAVRQHIGDQPVGTPLRVTTKDGTVYTGKFEGDTGSRIKVGKDRIRGTDIKSVEKLSRPEDAALASELNDAALKGDEKAVDAGIEKAVELRAERLNEKMDNDTLFDTDESMPGDPPVSLGANEFKEMEGANLFRNRRTQEDGTEIVETDAGTFRVERKGGMIHLDAVTGTDLTPGSTPKTTSGLPLTGKSKSGPISRLESLFDSIPKRLGWNWLIDKTWDFVGDVAFSPKTKFTRALRRQFTELDADPAISTIRNETQGARGNYRLKTLAPLLDLARSKGYDPTDKKKMIALGRALFEGVDLPDAPEVTQAFRKAFTEIGQEMVREGMISQETFETHKDKYFPLLNWVTPDPKKMKKEISGLERKKGGEGLTSEEELQLKSLRSKYSDAMKMVKTPEGLIHREGDSIKNLIDARDVNAASGRMRARTTETWEEAVNKGLNVEDTVRDAIVALEQENAAVSRLKMFRRIRDYGLSTNDKLVMPPEKDRPYKKGYTLVEGKGVNSRGLSVFGALEGHYVKDRLWADLEMYNQNPSDIGRAWNTLHAAAKENVTAFRLGGHAVQRIGNPLMLATGMGIPFSKMSRVIGWGRDIINKGKTEGIVVEVNGQNVEPTLERMAEWGVVVPDADAAARLGMDLSVDAPHEVGPMEYGAKKFVTAAQSLLPTKRLKDKLRKLYGSPDQQSRAGAYIYLRTEAGLSHQDAVRKVSKVYDMSNVPPGVKKAGRFVSFLRFTYAMLRNSREMAKQTPAVMTKSLLALAALRYGHRQALGMDDEEYERALWAAYPGDSIGATMKRLTAIPWLPEFGGGKSKAGWVSVWNMFPAQTMLQFFPGASDSPAEEKPGGLARKVTQFFTGAANIVVKPVGEVPWNTDAHSGQPNLIQNKYGADEESDWSMFAGQLRHGLGSFVPQLATDTFRAADAAVGGLPVGSVRRPNAEGNFPSALDEIARAAGANVRRPDYQRAEIVKAREKAESLPGGYTNERGDIVPKRDTPPAEAGEIEEATKTFKATIIAASAKRAMAWLREGNEERAIREIRSHTRLGQMVNDLDQETATELYRLAAKISDRLKD